MNANIHAQEYVLVNLALGREPTHGFTKISEVRGYKITLATLVKKGLVTVDETAQGTVRLTPLGARKASTAVYRLQHRAAAQAAILSTPTTRREREPPTPDR